MPTPDSFQLGILPEAQNGWSRPWPQAMALLILLIIIMINIGWIWPDSMIHLPAISPDRADPDAEPCSLRR